MMPKPNQSRQNKYNTYDNRPSNSEHVLLETRPNILLYSDNFVLKIVVLFLLVFLFAPLITVFYGIQSNLLTTFQINLENMTFIMELILIFCILIVIIKIGLDVLDWNYTLYTLTEQRVIIRRGFFHKEKIAMSYSKIQDIEVSQSIIERILNCGNMIIYGGHDNSETILDAVPNPSKVEDIVMNKISNVQSDSYKRYSNFNSTYDPRFNKYNTQSNNYQQDYQYDNYNQNFDNQRDYRGIQEENTKTSKWKQMMGDKKKSKRELDEIINKHQNRFKKYK